MWVNLGDKYASAGGHTAVGATSQRAGRSNLGELVRGSEKVPEGFREKSLMGLPWRYVIGCIDGLAAPRRARRCVLHAVMSCPLCCEDERQQWILRAEVVWSKPTGLPEHAVDRVRRSHEHWFHLTKEPTYFSNIDEIREPLGEWAERARQRDDAGDGGRGKRGLPGYEDINRSAWQEGNPLGKLPGSVWEVAIEPLSVPEWVGVDHFAAFPQEWPRRLILGWSPMPGVVLDPFVGTGTTVGVARALGRFGVGVDLSADYLRLARWRVWDSGHFSKTVTRTNQERQGSLL
jgi:site-specific DNA-methyltransferase (cytosine-N4-specific)